MRRASRRQWRAGAVVLPLLTLGSCIWPEPVTEEPPPVDSAPSIVIPDPNNNQVTLRNDCASGEPFTPQCCKVHVGFAEVFAPQGQPLFAQFYLNFGNPNISAGGGIQLGVSAGATAPYALKQRLDNATIYSLSEQPLAPLTVSPQALLPPGSVANTVTGFVSDQFPPVGEGPLQQPGSTHYTTSWVWQIVPDETCGLYLASLP